MTSNPRPKAVVFDLGKVLLQFDYGIVVRALAAQGTSTVAQIATLIDQAPLLFQYETGLISTHDFFQEVRKSTGYRGDLATFATLFGSIFSEITPMVELNRDLRLAGIPTYIFSNTNELAIQEIRRNFPFFRNFNDFILSYEERSMKPDAKIYESVEARTGLRGADLLYIDDRSENIEAGQQRGWQAWLHSDPALTVPEVRKRMRIGAAMM